MAGSSVLLRISVAKRRFRANWFLLWVVMQLMIVPVACWELSAGAPETGKKKKPIPK